MNLITAKISAAAAALAIISTLPFMDKSDYKEVVNYLQNNSQSTTVIESEKLTAPVNAVELCDDITIGWNLGNSLDAPGWGINSETSWGNPAVTKELILAVKKAGFDAVRVPTTWYNHCDSDYNIDEAWLDRVQTVVDYAYNEDMYVILNAHHENWNDPYENTLKEVKPKIKKIWTQIANRFKDYGKRLIFEGMNEPRWKNTQYEWNGGNAEGRRVVNEYNKTFVKTVRATGGNNRYRALMVPTYAASASSLNGFEVPDDKSIIVSIHAYSPYFFAMDENGTKKFDPNSSNSTAELTWLADKLYEDYISKGIGAIIGECGTVNKDNLSDRINWAGYFPKVFGEKGIPVFLWDNNAFGYGHEKFGLLNRSTLKWEYPDYLKTLIKTAQDCD